MYEKCTYWNIRFNRKSSKKDCEIYFHNHISASRNIVHKYGWCHTSAWYVKIGRSKYGLPFFFRIFYMGYCRKEDVKMNEIRVEMFIDHRQLYINVNGICLHYDDIGDDGFEYFKQTFEPMVNELQQIVIASNIEKELAEQ